MNKKFLDFRNSLAEDQLSDIINYGYQLADTLRDQNDDSKQEQSNQMGAVSLGISLALLEYYHEWLHLQNDDENQ